LKRCRRRGAALLEAIVAITLLVTAGVAMITHVIQTIDTARMAAIRDREVREAGSILQRALLWTRADLLARVGHSRMNCCLLDVSRESATVFRLAVSDTGTGALIIETAIYATIP
jgi:hypothetical protein